MIPLFQPNITESDIAAVAKAMSEGCIGPGRYVAEFEALLCEATGKRYAVCCNSGTTALMLAMKALGVESWSTVLVPAYGMLASANAARVLGANVSAADVTDDCFLDSLYIDHETEQAVVCINHNGHGCNDAELVRRQCEIHQLPLIEDECQSIGMSCAFRRGGSLSTLSFSVPKLVTTGQGGAVLTDLPNLAERVRNLTDHGGGWRETRIHQRIGGNFRMPDIAAALGCSQMRRLPQLVERREQIHQQYREHLKDAPGRLDCGWCVIYQTPRAEELIAHLRERGIEASRQYRCITSHPPYADGKRYPNAERAERELVYLPGGCSGMSDAQVHLVCQAIREFEEC